MHLHNTTEAFLRYVSMKKVVWVDILLGHVVCVYTREKIENNFLTRKKLGCISAVAFSYILQSGLFNIVTLTKSRMRALFRPSLLVPSGMPLWSGVKIFFFDNYMVICMFCQFALRTRIEELEHWSKTTRIN